MDEEPKLSIVLFSGTDDKLNAAAILITGAAAMGRPVDVFLQYWGLDAFRADRIRKDHGVSAEAGPEGAAFLRKFAEEHGQQHWADTLAQAKDIGEVGIYACSLSMDVFGITKGDLDPLVDGVWGVAAFTAAATGQVLFI